MSWSFTKFTTVPGSINIERSYMLLEAYRQKTYSQKFNCIRVDVTIHNLKLSKKQRGFLKKKMKETILTIAERLEGDGETKVFNQMKDAGLKPGLTISIGLNPEKILAELKAQQLDDVLAVCEEKPKRGRL